MNALPVLGLDTLYKGEGSTCIKLLGVISFANIKGHPKANQSSLGRFLSEMMLNPMSAYKEYVEWEEI